MNITKGEYTRFALTGRLKLIALYGEPVHHHRAPAADIVIYRLFDFYVAMVTDKLRCNECIAAEPVTAELAIFYRHHPGF